MSKTEFTSLTGEIGTLKAHCEELRVRNDMLQYHLERSNRQIRELEREVQEWRALYGNHKGDTLLVGWGKTA